MRVCQEPCGDARRDGLRVSQTRTFIAACDLCRKHGRTAEVVDDPPPPKQRPRRGKD